MQPIAVSEKRSMEITINSDVFGLSSTKHLRRNAVLHPGDDVVALPPHIPMRCWAQHLRPDSMVWPHHTCSIWPLLGAPKIPLYCTEYNWPMALAPMNEESAWAQWGKNLIGKKLPLNWVEWSACVVSLDINSLTAKSVLAGEKLVATYSIST